jgi:hypothetical protein
MCYPIQCMQEMYSVVYPSNISFNSFKIFVLLLFLKLDDGGCLNSILPLNIFPLTLTHFLQDQDLESF